jgi:alpha-glucosidase
MRRATERKRPELAGSQWWRDAVFYQIYVRSFADSDGDGVGDLEGIRSKLGYLELLGVDALWLTPFYRSPMADHGYDITDPRVVDPVYGNLGDFDALVRDAHARGIKVTIDLVPNHTSNIHAWFTAMAASPGGRERDRLPSDPWSVSLICEGPAGSGPGRMWV